MYIQVHVTPGAKKELFNEEKPHVFHVAVKEKAERNMANRRVLLLIARHFAVPVNRARIIAGHRSLKKIISIDSST